MRLLISNNWHRKKMFLSFAKKNIFHLQISTIFSTRKNGKKKIFLIQFFSANSNSSVGELKDITISGCSEDDEKCILKEGESVTISLTFMTSNKKNF